MEARFAIAARHSRMVRILRVAVPAAVMLSMAAHRSGVGLQSIPDAAAQAAARHGKPRRLRHQDHDGIAAYGRLHATDQRPYEVWAKTATQDVTDPDHLDLKTLRAKVLMRRSVDRHAGCPHGLMNTKEQLLDLHKDIFLQTSTGYEARLESGLCRYGQGHRDVGRACRCQIDQRNDVVRPAEDHRRRRGRQVRRQCRDASREHEYG